jgi:hypothetical protein
VRAVRSEGSQAVLVTRPARPNEPSIGDALGDPVEQALMISLKADVLAPNGHCAQKGVPARIDPPISRLS